ncbi:bifunctional DNA primase/polymerase [Bifidobacterium sp. SO1]|uniref:bifunctional DNA primase/polymerase n=1 Tax=Bifidobacterium sp. SO1 TaxID=2809029 RepID=UPI001BDC4861|nr:bifunctional DNA primase/polymerase [Bifidobacterium sp. SO1]MBT1162923.1 bifunctional DNA primase/polymerase [Bifidobacterium sp. SO1]
MTQTDNPFCIGRPGLNPPLFPGHVDGGFLADLAGQHVFLAQRIALAKVCRSMTPVEAGGEDMENRLQSVVQREGQEAWTWEDPTGMLPIWVCRMISETIAPIPDLRILPDPNAPGGGVLYRRVLPDYVVTEAPVRWAPVGSLKITYGGGKKDMDLPGIDSWIRDALLLAGQTIRRGCRFDCTDGRIIFEHDPKLGAWTRTERRGDETQSWIGAGDYECREAGFVKSEWKPCATLDADRPLTYTVSVPVTCNEAMRLSREASSILWEWTGGSLDSLQNLKRSLTAPFLRSHPECAYVYQGPGGTGKSSLAKDLMAHLGDQATTLSLDLLGQPTAMSAENKMLDLTSHQLALSDDYDPTHGRFDRILPALKTLLTGLLPFSARRQGENATDGIPQAVHILTTNYHLPLGESEAEQRRFAFATMISPNVRADRYLPFRNRWGFWPFMLCSATCWGLYGDRQYRAAAFMDPESLSDTEIQMIRTALEDGLVFPEPGLRVSWKNIGLIRTSTKKGTETGRPRTAYRPAPEGHPLHGIWDACVRAIGEIPEDRPVVEPIPDPLPDMTADRWASMISESGPRIFPCRPDKSPIGDNLPGHSWQKAANDPALDMSRPTGSGGVWGVTTSSRYVWLDLDCHAKDEQSGWEQIQTEVGEYGSVFLPRTYAVRTPSGGVHLLYRLPDGFDLKVKSRTHNGGGQIDLKLGGSGYVIMGGSRLPDGRAYRPIDTPAGDRIPDLSARLVNWMTECGAIEDPNAKKADASPAASNPGFLGLTRPSGNPGGGSPDLTPIPEGSRNDTLYRWGYGRHKAHPTECARIDGELIQRAVNSGLPEHEARQILTSIHRAVNA